MTYKVTFRAAFIVCVISLIYAPAASARGYTEIADFKARLPIHVLGSSSQTPAGFSPSTVKRIYNLPQSGGHGTIAIIAAYDDKQIENDLAVFDRQFDLPSCTVSNGCLEKHLMQSKTSDDSGWDMETSLDVEWSHAIAPNAKILLVAAHTASGTNLLSAIDYARSRMDVVAVSMSWGGPEFSTEVSLDGHFISNFGATFFASSGDNGSGVSWPAVSSNVVGVGGTVVNLQQGGSVRELAWNGSGGGISRFEKQPGFQSDYNIPKASKMRAVPDVAYNASPTSGFSIYKSSTSGKGAWYVVGGTSAGAPQWAAIKSLGLSADNAKFYSDKAGSGNKSYFRDITSGSNGDCSYYCDARKHYDYVTGLGSPLTIKF